MNLRTGEIEPNNPERYLTKITAVARGGECPRFLEFLSEITAGDESLQDFIQRMFGYVSPARRRNTRCSSSTAPARTAKACCSTQWRVSYTNIIAPRRLRHLQRRTATAIRQSWLTFKVDDSLQQSKPRAVTAATQAYLEAEDAMAVWIDDVRQRSERLGENGEPVFVVEDWAERNGEYVGSTKRFVQNLETRGVTEHRKKFGRGHDGLSLTKTYV